MQQSRKLGIDEIELSGGIKVRRMALPCITLGHPDLSGKRAVKVSANSK